MSVTKNVIGLMVVTLFGGSAAQAQVRTPKAYIPPIEIPSIEVPSITIEPMTIGPMTIEPMTIGPMMIEPMIMEPMMLAPMAMEQAEAALAQVEMMAPALEQAGAALADIGITPLADAPWPARPRALRQSYRGPSVPREAWAQGDPADSLYRAARAALNRRDFQVASNLFAQVRSRYPKSNYVADALYWDAYARWRQGGEDRLRRALALLDEQRKKYPKSATETDAAGLATQIRSDLARGGDPEAAQAITALAAELAETPAPPGTPRVARAPNVTVTPRPGRAPRPPRPARLSGDADEVPDGCDADTYADKVAALNALLQMNSERAIPILKNLLEKRDDCSAPLRRKAVFLVAQQRSPENADILLNSVKNDPDAEVRRQGVFWLGQVEGDRAVDILGEILRTSSDFEMQKAAMFALSQHKSPKAATIIRQYAERNDAPVELRKTAIFDLSQQPSSENVAFLRGLYPKLDDPELKERVLFSVSQMRNEGTGQWLLEIAANEKEPIEMRKKAIFWAGQQNETNFAAFSDLYDKMPDREMKNQLIFVYSQRREPEAVDRLMEIALKEKDRDLKSKAIFWLGQSNDPRVPKFLEEILNK